MSQDFNTTSKKSKRVTRAQRNQPVLVTPGASEQDTLSVEETSTPDMAPVALVDTPDTSPTPKRRLAGFFSTVGKEDTATTNNEADIAKARIARATRGKVPPVKAAMAASEEEKKPAKPAAGARPAQPQKPKSLFKPRYIFGMLVYLIAADFLGGFEKNILTSMGVEKVLTKLNLFGFPITVTPSGLSFIATLIIILIVLVRLDFLPTNLNSMAGTPPKRGTTAARNTASSDTGDGPRSQPLTIKQGVQGADDDLYRAYRTNQRREKKR